VLPEPGIVRIVHHKIFLAPFVAKLSMGDGQRLWEQDHGPIWLGSPGLRGYVQNRPVRAWWDRMPRLACAEDWFESREDEQALHQSEYYRQTVLPDEERMFSRENAWVSTVTGVEVLRPGDAQAFRVLSFGAERPDVSRLAGTGRAELLHLRRPAPLSSSPLVLSVWTAALDEARVLAETIGGFAFVVAPAALRPPPLAPWALSS
jgi:hypothetical protein